MGELHWPVDYAAVSAKDADQLQSAGDEDREKFEDMAANFLWNWTGRVFGTFEEDLRPCAEGCGSLGAYRSTFWGKGPYPPAGLASGGYGAWAAQLLRDGSWHGMGCGCLTSCTCGLDGTKKLYLPGPIASVTSVKLNGVTLNPDTDYLVVQRRWLYSRNVAWPACQDLLAPATAVGTFEVIYERGIEVPIGGQIAAGVLAVEFSKLLRDPGKCSLPARMQQVVREGITVELTNPLEGLDKGQTSLWEVDSWVASVNRPRPYASVRSVDVGPRAVSRGRY